MYVKRLSASNFRCFGETVFDLHYPGRPGPSPLLPNVNLIVGINGSGKTSLLAAIALACLAPVLDGTGFVPFNLVRRAERNAPSRARLRAALVLHGQDLGGELHGPPRDETMTIEIERIRDVEKLRPQRQLAGHWLNLFDNDAPAFLVLGYGSGRQVEPAQTYDAGARRRGRQARYERVAGLFEQQVSLAPLTAWLPEIEAKYPDRYARVVALVDRLLPDGCRFTGEREDGEYVFAQRGTRVPFGSLSDGYRSYTSWILDVVFHLSTTDPPLRDPAAARGVVLVDEVDMNMHPEWQRTVVRHVATALPNIQFVLTTHSPIIVGTLEAPNILLTELDQSGEATARRLDEPVHGRSAEQILVGPYFNLATTRAQGMVQALTGLARRAEAGDPQAAVAYLRALTEGLEADPAPDDGAPTPTRRG